MKRKLLLLILLGLIVFLSACRKDKVGEGTGYGITHKDNVGVATIKVKNGIVEDLSFDEVLLPNTWAEIIVGTDVPEDVIVVESKWYAKYLVIGNRHFTGSTRDEVLTVGSETFPKQNIKYTSDDIEDLYIWLRQSEANCGWYAQTVLNDEAFIAKSDWTKAHYQLKNSGFTKREINYWPGTEETLGWEGNMEAIVDALEGTKMDAGENITKGEDGYWRVNGVLSGATLTNFKDYYQVALRAYNKAQK